MIHLSAIKANVAHSSDKPALFQGGTYVSWRDLQYEAERKIFFIQERFGKNLPTQACYLSPNCLELISWLAALTTLNITVTGLDYSLPFSKLKTLLKSLQPEFILIDEDYFDFNPCSLIIGNERPLTIDLNAENDRNNKHTSCYIKSKVASCLDRLEKKDNNFLSVGLTSGTTGLPKLVIRNKSFDQRRFSFFTNRYAFNSNDNFLVSMPLYHAAGNGWARLFMSLGATLYISDLHNPKKLGDMIVKHHITATVMSPPTLKVILEGINENGQSLKHALKWVLIGGKYFPVQQKMAALTLLGPVIYEYYGTTETGVNTIAEPIDLQTHPQSVGCPFEGNDIAIIGPKDSHLAIGEMGRVAVASYMNMDSYSKGTPNQMKLGEKTYLLTSDKGYLDKEGRLYLLNRLTDAKNNHNIYRLEESIRSLPCVADVALIQSSNRSGSQINCVIEERHNTTDHSVLFDRIKKLLQSERMDLLHYKSVQKIPYSPSGKVRICDIRRLVSNSS